MSAKITGTEPTVPVSPVAVPPDGPPATTPSGGSTAATLAALGAAPPPGSEVSQSVAASSTPAHHELAGRYQILGLVGSGGMGTVYRARDRELDEIVALKMLRREVLAQAGILDRFRQEAKLARRVTHANVARTYDIGESDGDKFLTMEFIDGESLAAKLTREGALAPHEVRTIASGICAGLHAAHAAGILHRDLKPDNVLLARDGRVVITDFGIARAFTDSSRAATLGVALGTPSYMAPEQVEGVTDLDARCDVYALGAMLYECLVGERAWNGESIWAIAAARLMHPPPDPRAKRPELPGGAAELVLKCMARKREDRFASAADVAGALAALTMPTQVARASLPPPAPAPIDADAKAIAVLPFRNLGAPEDQYLAEGLTDDLVDGLSMTRGLRVLARGAVARAHRADRDAREIGRELRVQVVVDGSIRRLAGMLRISARVVSVADGFQLWAKRFDRSERDVLQVSDDVANAVAEALTVRRDAPARPAPTDARAVDLYLRARHALHKGWFEDVNEAIALFEQALAIAPDDPTILAGYARAQVRRFTFQRISGGNDADVLAEKAAEKALAHAPHLGEARAALAQLKWVLGDHVGCARDLREALRVAPSSSDLNEIYGRMLLEAGEPQRAIACLSAAVALEPTIDMQSGDLVRGKALMGDWSAYDAALEEQVPAGTLSTPRWFMLTRLTMWRRDPALTAAVRSKLQAHQFALKQEILQILDMCDARVPVAVVQDGLDAWSSAPGRAKRGPMFFRQLGAELAAFTGDSERALRAMEDADGVGLIDLTWVDRCPLLEPLRGEPRFQAVRARVAARAREALDVLEGRIA
jgi:serine/threonine-protein kinase